MEAVGVAEKLGGDGGGGGNSPDELALTAVIKGFSQRQKQNRALMQEMRKTITELRSELAERSGADISMDLPGNENALATQQQLVAAPAPPQAFANGMHRMQPQKHRNILPSDLKVWEQEPVLLQPKIEDLYWRSGATSTIKGLIFPERCVSLLLAILDSGGTGADHPLNVLSEVVPGS